MQKIPEEVVAKCFSTAHGRIKFIDADSGLSSFCHLHYVKRNDVVERFVGRGGFNYVRNNGINSGQRVAFIVHVHSADEITVKTLH